MNSGKNNTSKISDTEQHVSKLVSFLNTVPVDSMNYQLVVAASFKTEMTTVAGHYILTYFKVCICQQTVTSVPVTIVYFWPSYQSLMGLYCY